MIFMLLAPYISVHSQYERTNALNEIQYNANDKTQFMKIPEDGIPESKHLGYCTCHELCYMICILLYGIECHCLLIQWVQPWCQPCDCYVTIIIIAFRHWSPNVGVCYSGGLVFWSQPRDRLSRPVFFGHSKDDCLVRWNPILFHYIFFLLFALLDSLPHYSTLCSSNQSS
jgi:hypothetical protein